MQKELQCAQEDYKEAICEYEMKFGKDSLVNTGILEQVDVESVESLGRTVGWLYKALMTETPFTQYSGELWNEDLGLPNYDKINHIADRLHALVIEQDNIINYIRSNTINYHSIDLTIKNRIAENNYGF